MEALVQQTSCPVKSELLAARSGPVVLGETFAHKNRVRSKAGAQGDPMQKTAGKDVAVGGASRGKVELFSFCVVCSSIIAFLIIINYYYIHQYTIYYYNTP